MQSSNGSIHFDERVESFKAGMHKLVDRMTTKPNWVGKSADWIREHPIASVGIALGAGYALFRIIRR